MVLVSEPVRGRFRATELPCSLFGLRLALDSANDQKRDLIYSHQVRVL